MPISSAPATAFAVTAAIILLCAPLARRIGLVSMPGAHRSHDGRVPVVGGIGMFCGFLFAVLLVPTSLHEFRPLFAAAALLVIVGVLDDFQELRPRARFAAQIIAGLIIIVWGGVQLHDLGGLLGPAPLLLGPVGAAFTLFAVVGVINAFNLIDGVDGLAGGLSLIVLMLLAAAATTTGNTLDRPMLSILAAATAAFLIFNLRYPGHPRARVFMGDAGSMFLGLTLAWFLIHLSQGEDRSFAPITGVWLIAIPLLDTLCTMVRRISCGRSPIDADRGHLHHLLQALGLSPGQAVAALLGLSLLIGAASLLCERIGVPESWLFAAFCLVFPVYCAGIELGWRRATRRGNCDIEGPVMP
jgi:UDP-GlcNAc:undecaprenyl-phosphate GlcNAc-1-phosphate transferase